MRRTPPSFKSVGLNLNGVPTDAHGSARARGGDRQTRGRAPHRGWPEDRAASRRHRNITVFNTDIKDFQAQVVNASVGVLRGYLANAEKVRVRGVEFDGSARVHRNLSFYGAAAYTDGKYVSFPDAPPPLEETGGPQVKDISGSDLPGISKWALSLGGEYVNPTGILGRAGELFGAVDASYRSSFSSSASASRYLVVDGYAPAQRSGRLPVGGRVGCLAVVPESAGQRLLRVAVRRTRRLWPVRRTTRRAQNGGRDAADGSSIAQLTNSSN